MAGNSNEMSIDVEVHEEQSGQSTEIIVPAGQSTANAVLDEIRRMKDSFSSELRSVSERVERLAETVYASPAPKKRRTAETVTSGRPWHKWRDSGSSAPLQHESDDESGMEGDEGTELSESSKSLVISAFSSSLQNSERRRIRTQYPHSGLPQTRCPKMDAVFKSASGKADTKTADAELGKIQAFVFDPVGPLLHLLEKVSEEDTDMTREDIAHELKDALRLIGNTSSHISTIRRKKILKALNPEIQDLATEEGHFKEAAPQLFGAGFEKVMKDRAESIKILQRASKPATSSAPQPKKFFSKGRSTAPPRGGGQNHGRREKQWQQRRPAATSSK